MPANIADRLPDVLRLVAQPKLSVRAIADMVGVSKSAVSSYRNRVRQLGLPAEHFEDLESSAAQALLGMGGRRSTKLFPDFANVERRLHEDGMTRWRLWQEHREVHGEASPSYPRFSAAYRLYLGRKNTTMRTTHIPGQAVYVDFSGKRPSYLDAASGKPVPVELYVAVLGYSSYTFVCCTKTQAKHDWIEANTRMLHFFGGVPMSIVPDNLKAAVEKPGAVPLVQRDYARWAHHYGTSVLPARSRKPRDKALVERSVALIQQHMLPELAKQTFTSFEALDAEVQRLLTTFNTKAFSNAERGSRRSQFEAVERAALNDLPPARFVYAADIATRTVPSDYHIEAEGRRYSVPYILVGKKVTVRAAGSELVFLHDGIEAARHARASGTTWTVTNRDHQTAEHQAQGRRTPEGLLDWAKGVGPSTHRVMAHLFDHDVKLKNLHAACALQDLEQHHPRKALEAAAKEAVKLKTYTLTCVKRFLSKG